MENEPQISIEEYLNMLLITSMRIYDIQLLLLYQVNQEAAEKIKEEHKNLEFLGPDPWKSETKEAG